MISLFMICIITFFLSLASICYELVLAQSLSAFLDNTVLRYSITIGLYMCSLGFGSLMAGKKWVEKPILNLLKIETCLTLLGGGCVVLLFMADAYQLGRLGISIVSYGLIIMIGLLSGFEIPLLVKMAKDLEQVSVNKILSINYVGAFIGTLFFAFYLYPTAGLLAGAILIGIINSICGLLLYTQENQVDKIDKKEFYLFLYMLMLLFLVLSISLVFSNHIEGYFINQYLSA